MEYKAFGWQLTSFHIHISGIDRQDAERLLAELVFRYLPLDLNLIARGAVMSVGSDVPKYWTDRVRISGGRVLDREDSYSLQVSVPPGG